ncbi:MAG: hypothetical protein FJ272_13880, partial [Planctomycetes bacterium]|nr:hypothetical protein [Planctomycetota bacterium]
KFYALHQALRADPDLKESRQLAEALSPVPPPAAAAKLYPVFSPRSTIIAVETCAQFIDHARDLVCFTAPFALHDRLEDALDDPGDRFLKFGLLNSRGNVVERVHRTAGNRIASATALTTKLERFQKESLHHRGVFIHTKFILIDPLGPAPIVVTGSANFSDNSCRNNDENQLIIRDAPAVADVYFGEFMRLYDHYTFRDFVSRVKDKPKARYLAPDNSWSAKYFAGGREERDREVFSS